MTQKIEVIERENDYLKEELKSTKSKFTSQQQTLKETSVKLEHLEKEKILADKVTGELLQRIQRYESDLNTLKDQVKLS